MNKFSYFATKEEILPSTVVLSAGTVQCSSPYSLQCHGSLSIALIIYACWLNALSSLSKFNI